MLMTTHLGFYAEVRLFLELLTFDFFQRPTLKVICTKI